MQLRYRYTTAFCPPIFLRGSLLSPAFRSLQFIYSVFRLTSEMAMRELIDLSM